MAVARIKLEENTWTDLSEYGKRFVVRAEEGQVVQASLKATEPTAATHSSVKNGTVEYILGDDALKPWARIVAGGYISIDHSGSAVVLTSVSAAADAGG